MPKVSTKKPSKPERYQVLVGDCLEHLRALPSNSIDSIVTDPPYGLGKEPDALEMLRDWMTEGHHDVKGRGFMGKEWDAFVPQPSVWKECLRVLKPGGHLLSFGGSRTYDLITLGLRIAGFEVRDCVMWVYGSGFPKSLDVSKAIDAADRIGMVRSRSLQFTLFMRSTGITATEINTATKSSMASHYLTEKEQPAVPTEDMFRLLRPLIIAKGITIPDEIEEMVRQRTIASENLKRRSVVDTMEMIDTSKARAGFSGKTHSPNYDGKKRLVDITEPYTDAARQWQGWGTALKPAYEPCVIARKPLDGTVAENVLAFGTGAINVDGCRVGTESTRRPDCAQMFSKGGVRDDNGNPALNRSATGNDAGRWPANLIHDGSEEVLRLFPDTGPSTSRVGERTGKSAVPSSAFTGQSDVTMGHDDAGGSAARFFYCPKASKEDRDAGLEDFDQVRRPSVRRTEHHVPNLRTTSRTNFHPTVKPTDLMAYLCRLVTPPGGTVLDPFMGSGSTGKGAVAEGFKFIGIELDPNYAQIAEARIEWMFTPAGECSREERPKLFDLLCG